MKSWDWFILQVLHYDPQNDGLYSNPFSLNFCTLFVQYDGVMKVIKKFISESTEDTIKIAVDLAPRFKSNDVVLLEGNLGSGKTFLVKEICKILETEDEASSPSFAIVYQYSGPVPVNHFDLYRIKDIRELDNLGWEEHLSSGAITFIEWPGILEAQLSDYFKIQITFNDNQREFTLLKTN